MKGIFSIDDFSDPFWEAPPLPPIDLDSEKVLMAEEVNQSQPEWAFEMFLKEISSSMNSEPVGNSKAIAGVSSVQHSFRSVSEQYSRGSGNWDCAAPPSTVIAGSNEYVLKNNLETEFSTAEALTERSVKPEALYSSPKTQFQTAQFSLLPQGSLMIPEEFAVLSSLPAELKQTGVPMKQVMSGSLGEYSEEDDFDEENETTGSLKPEDVRKSRRMLSNRESARRSRKRKQEQTSDLETQVNELKAEHSALLRQLSNVNQQYDEASVGNRILKADIETLRVKVKMAEETIKRETGIDPLLLGRSLTRIDSSCIPAFQLQPQPQSNLNHLPNPNIGIPIIVSPRLENSFAPPPPSSSNSQTKSHLHVSPSTSSYGWNTEPQNDSAWPKD